MAGVAGAYRRLLESIGASQWEVTTQALGRHASDLLSSAGMPALQAHARADLDRAAGVWVAQLRVVLINCAHPALNDLDERTFEAMLARVAWHEWAHALAVARAGWDDVAAGERLLELAPEGIRGFIRRPVIVVASTPMSSSPRSTLCSCRVVAAARPGSPHGLRTRSTNSSGE